ncbi:hypothetical protein BVC80_1689g31 [Macleaya cordata]|uniref:Uncharacterized protein n=1 Tax=Macleaya cordata TaxID=56857 RepID=A0A200RAY3_MACCD|nr:hypothetical protein BVC80_1689g31 [Macleaya cordata]
MAISDVVVGNITSLYLGVIATMKAFGLITGRTYSGVFVLLVSSTVVLLILVASLSWDVSRKAATYAFLSSSSSRDHHHSAGCGGPGCGGPLPPHQEGHKSSCRGGICWHGAVAVRSTVSQVRFSLPSAVAAAAARDHYYPATASSSSLN